MYYLCGVALFSKNNLDFCQRKLLMFTEKSSQSKTHLELVQSYLTVNCKGKGNGS